MLWKIYFALYSVLWVGLGAATLLGGQDVYTWDVVLAFVLGFLGLVPLYGYAYKKRIGHRAAWVILMGLLLVFEVVIPGMAIIANWDRLDMDHTRWTLILGEAFVVLLAIYFYATVRYIFFQPEIWKAANSNT